MKTPGFQIVERPGKELDVFNADIVQFVEFREMLPYHEVTSFVDRDGRIDAHLRPLPNVVPINKRWLVKGEGVAA